MMDKEMEDVAAALIGVVAKNQKFMTNTQSDVKELVQALKDQSAAIASIPTADMTPLEKALTANTKQMATLAKAILASIPVSRGKTKWDFEIDRGLDGRIQSVAAKPNETVN